MVREMSEWLEDNSPYLPMVLSFLIALFFFFEPNLRQEYWPDFFPRFVAGVLVVMIGTSITFLQSRGRQKRARPRFPKLDKYLMPLFCLILIIIHAMFPEYAIDTITIALIIIILFPWLIPYLGSIKFPGGTEITFREVQRLEELSAGIEIQLRDVIPDEIEPTRQDLLRFDSNLALASLRIDIERKLKQIARQKEIFTNRKSLGTILKSLYTNEIIGSSEYDTLRSVIDICNKAVHAEKVDYFAASKILDIGEFMLSYLSSIQ